MVTAGGRTSPCSLLYMVSLYIHVVMNLTNIMQERVLKGSWEVSGGVREGYRKGLGMAGKGTGRIQKGAGKSLGRVHEGS